jgi:hypothetical protein
MICWSFREFIGAELSRSALARMLKRHKVPSIRELRAKRKAQEAPAPKGFKPYEPGYLQVDVQYLPVMPDETRRRSWPSTARPAGWIWRSWRTSTQRAPPGSSSACPRPHRRRSTRS